MCRIWNLREKKTEKLLTSCLFAFSRLTYPNTITRYTCEFKQDSTDFSFTYLSSLHCMSCVCTCVLYTLNHQILAEWFLEADGQNLMTQSFKYIVKKQLFLMTKSKVTKLGKTACNICEVITITRVLFNNHYPQNHYHENYYHENNYYENHYHENHYHENHYHENHFTKTINM